MKTGIKYISITAYGDHKRVAIITRLYSKQVGWLVVTGTGRMRGGTVEEFIQKYGLVELTLLIPNRFRSNWDLKTEEEVNKYVEQWERRQVQKGLWRLEGLPQGG